MKNFNMILIDKLQKISALSSGKINKYEDLTGEEIVPSNQKQTIEQAIFTFLLWDKPLKNKQKQLRIKEKNKPKQLKSIENKYMNLMRLLKMKYLRNIWKEIFKKLIKERALDFADIKDKFDLNNGIKTKENKPKNFRNYQILLQLFENLMVGDVNPKEVLGNEVD